MEYNVREREQTVHRYSSRSCIQLTFKTLTLVGFRCSIKEKYAQLPEKTIKMLLPFQLYIYIRPDFLHTLQPYNMSQRPRMQKQI